VSGEALAGTLEGLGLDSGVDVSALWEASEIVERQIGDEPVTPLTPRVAIRAAEHNMPAGLVAALDAQLRANASGDRLDDVLAELKQIRAEAGWPPLAAPIGQILGSQALLHVLSGQRYTTIVDELRGLLEGRYGEPPGPIDKTVRRALTLVSDGHSEEAPIDLDALREEAAGLAASEEELLLLALFGEEAEPLLRTIRGRSGGQDSLVGGRVDQQRAELIREVVRIVQESGVGEVTIEESGMRVSVRRTEERAPVAAAPPVSDDAPTVAAPLELPETDGAIRVESPMVGTFYRAPQPGSPPFVEIGDTVAAGQTLCILEAMKLMNELKTENEGVVRAIHAENAQPVEYGQLLFELEPVAGQPLDAL
jgi:oxaloacetate decarboxylase alpha subunit